VPDTWQQVTLADIDRELVFDRLPPDTSVVTPIAPPGQEPDLDLDAELADIDATLSTWAPAYTGDPVQRVRNLLYVAGVHDVAQTPLEPYVPRLVYGMLVQNTDRDDLIKILFWIALHPEEGDLPARAEFIQLGLRGVPNDAEDIRNRAAIYAVKLLGRLTGRIQMR
jgi:hypothetical protein